MKQKIVARCVKYLGPLWYVRLSLFGLSVLTVSIDLLQTGAFNWQVELAAAVPVFVGFFITRSEEQMVSIFGANWKLRMTGLGQLLYTNALQSVINVGKFSWPIALASVGQTLHSFLGKGKDTHTLEDGQQVVMPKESKVVPTEAIPAAATAVSQPSSYIP